MTNKPSSFPSQSQAQQPGKEFRMRPQPEYIREDYKGSGKLKGKVALITGGDSGIGRAVAVHFAREGADLAIVYLNEDKDAKKTQELIKKEGQKCILIKGDISKATFCKEAVEKTSKQLKKLDILINNAAVHFPEDRLTDITTKNFKKTFETNVYGMYFITKEALEILPDDGCIINTTSVTAYRGSDHLIDYAATKGAIVSFTRSLAKNLAERGIRVNGVAPGPIWTPLIPAAFDNIEDFGQDTPLGRAGQPSEVAPAYVLLASKDGSYITGQIIHVNGGEVVGG